MIQQAPTIGVELLLSGPLSWPQLVGQRLLAVVLGAAVITSGAIIRLVAGGRAAGANLNALGLGWLAADTLLLAGALGAVALLVVAWLRRTAAVAVLAVLAVLAAGSYLLVYLVRLFAWPDWVTRLSFFGVYVNPYLELPPRSGLVVLTILAVAGSLLAVAQRSPKTACPGTRNTLGPFTDNLPQPTLNRRRR